jgi:hypothetical protein
VEGGKEGAKGAWDVAENRKAGTRKVENVGPPPRAVEDGITGNRRAVHEDTKGDETQQENSFADRITDLQAVAHDATTPDASVKAQPDDASASVAEAPAPAPAPTPTPAPAPAPAPAPTSTPTTAPTTPSKPKDIRSDTGYHPALLHPYTPDGSSPTSGTFFPTSSTHDTSPSASIREKHSHGHERGHGVGKRESTASFGSGSTGRKKVGFFDKVRGEAKVIVGKIEHKQEKVEKGKRILHGED